MRKDLTFSDGKLELRIKRLEKRNADFIAELQNQRKQIALIQKEIDNPRWH